MRALVAIRLSILLSCLSAPLIRADDPFDVLDDDAYEVRTAVLRLLLDGQDPEETVRAVLAAWKRAEKEWKRLHTRLTEMNEGRGKFERNDPLSGERVRTFTFQPSYTARLLEAMGHLPDGRIETALVRVLKSSPNDLPGVLGVAAAKAACTLGTRKSVGALVDFQQRLGEALEEGKVSVRYPREGPMLAMDIWPAMSKEPDHHHLAAIAEALSALANRRNLGPAPTSLAAWEDWFDEHEDAFGESPGKLAEPVRVEPAEDDGE